MSRIGDLNDAVRQPDNGVGACGRLSRRTLLGGAAGAAGAFTTARVITPAGAKELAPMTFLGRLAVPRAQDLPDDAAPPDQQVYVTAADPTVVRVLDFWESVYQRPSAGAFDVFSDPLTRMDRNFDIIPGAALDWESDETGTIWTFNLDPNLVWTDGNPVTAEDWVATFRYGADPDHGWDFSWFFQGVVRNWTEAVNGDVPLEELGVRQGDNPNQLIIETEAAAPYLPSMMIYSLPLSAAALAEYGPLYNVDPATHVSSGPFVLQSFDRDRQLVCVRNEQYQGSLDVPVNTIVVKLAAPNTWFTLYQADEIDYMQDPAPQELQLAQNDPEISQQIYSSVGDFRTFYLFFDLNTAPFDDIRVRQAFSHAVDRDAIQQAVLGPLGLPAYSWLAPGFPAANSEELSDIQRFDPEQAQALLAEAGFEGGADFPSQTMLLRAENPLNQTVAQAVAASISQTLGISIEVSNIDFTQFMSEISTIPFGYVSYGMDYLDASNMLSVWKSGGRHPWANEEFDRLVDEAAAFLGDSDERTAMFQEAERILVEDVPGVFIYHGTPVQLVKPWVRGEVLEPDRNGLVNIHWPGYTAMSTVPQELYIGEDAPPGRV